MEQKRITVCGGGLAGCEAAWQAANRGVKVRLFEMKPKKYTPAHHNEGLAELVCSNSLRSEVVTNAVGLLKEEMRKLGSLVIEAADKTSVPAGAALAVDREKFSAYITEKLKNCPNLTLVSEEVEKLPEIVGVFPSQRKDTYVISFSSVRVATIEARMMELVLGEAARLS